MSFTLALTDRLTPNYQKTTGITGGSPLTYTTALSNTLAVATGTASGQADLMYAGTRTLALSTSEDLDLAGSLLDVFGATLTFVKVKGIYVKAASGNTNNVVIGGAASNQFVGPFGAGTHTLAISPGMWMSFVHPTTGWTVTPATGDLLKVLNGGAGTSVTYDLIIWGTSV